MESSRPRKKQMLPSFGLQRRVQATRDESESDNASESQDDEAPSEEELAQSDSEALGSEPSDLEDDDDQFDEDDDEEEEDEEAEDHRAAAAQISFGALARAQASLPNAKQRKQDKKTKNSAQPTDSDSDSDSNDNNDRRRATGEKERHPDHTSTKNKKNLPQPKRASKHAPMEQTSKRQVSRKREVVSAPAGGSRVASRDPRFSAALGNSSAHDHTAAADEARARRNYAFLDAYRDSEMSELRAAIKKAPRGARRTEATEREKEKLKKTLASMEARRESRRRKDEAEGLVREHRRKEKELVATGAKQKPFYLKKSEQKRQLLVDRFKGMKGREVDRAIERRRKKLASRERRDMPMERRMR